MMNEPSVLDFIKSKLFPWKYPPVVIPGETVLAGNQQIELHAVNDQKLNELEALTHDDQIPSAYVHIGNVTSAQPIEETSSHAGKPAKERTRAGELAYRFPWLIMAALFFAITGQASLSPSIGRSWSPGVYLLSLGFLFAIAAAWRDEWQIHPFPKTVQQVDPARLRPRELTIGVIFSIAAFISFSNLLFTGFNLVLLALSVVFFTRSFGAPSNWLIKINKLPGIIKNKYTFTVDPKEMIRQAGKIGFVLAVISLVVYFRFSKLSQVPAEMNSDHAEKILDISNVLRGYTQIFFPNNGGREALHMYLAAGLHKYLHIPLRFDLLKISTTLVGFLSLPFIYLCGKEIGGRRIGLFAFLFAGVAYWPNVVSRVGLRLPFYLLFTASTMYFLLRGFRLGSNRAFIWAGISLGLGLYGYSADRILPLIVALAFGLYLIHPQIKTNRASLVLAFLVIVLISFVLFIPLLRYIVEQPDNFLFRTLTRMGSLERTIEEPPITIFFNNFARAFGMFSWSAGVIWPVSIPNYPALGIIGGALFYLGVALVLTRYIRQRNWQDLFLLLSIPVLFLPSVLALAFPSENPSLYRTGGASVPVFIMIAIVFDGLISSISKAVKTPWSKWFAWAFAALLFAVFALQEYDWVFNKYALQYRASAWNTSEMGAVAKDFIQLTGSEDTIWVMGVPHWADTRLVAIQAGFPQRDYALFADQIPQTLDDPRSKLFIIRPDDETSINALNQAYPNGWYQRFRSFSETKDFLIFIVPAKKTP